MRCCDAGPCSGVSARRAVAILTGRRAVDQQQHVGPDLAVIGQLQVGPGGSSPRRSFRRGAASPKTSKVLPLLCLHRLSSNDFVPAVEQFLGSSAGLPR
jgi:hypothetical protein